MHFYYCIKGFLLLFKDYNNGLSKEHCVPAERGQKNVRGVPVEEEFTPQQCMERIARTFDKLQLRAIVNLSYTDKYYNKLVSLACSMCCQRI